MSEQQWIYLSLVVAALIALAAFWFVKGKLGHRSRGSDFDPDLLSRFRTAIPDINVRDRLMNAERKKSPHKSESELITDVLEAYYRDRR